MPGVPDGHGAVFEVGLCKKLTVLAVQVDRSIVDQLGNRRGVQN